MVTMIDIKKVMKQVQHKYETSEEYDPGRPISYQIEASESGGGMSKFVLDRADNWYIQSFTADYNEHKCCINLARYSDADEY